MWKNKIITKKEPIITEIANSYLRNKMISEFKLIVKVQYEPHLEQKDKMIKQQNYLLNHID